MQVGSSKIFDNLWRHETLISHVLFRRLRTPFEQLIERRLTALPHFIVSLFLKGKRFSQCVLVQLFNSRNVNTSFSAGILQQIISRLVEFVAEHHLTDTSPRPLRVDALISHEPEHAHNVIFAAILSGHLLCPLLELGDHLLALLASVLHPPLDILQVLDLLQLYLLFFHVQLIFPVLLKIYLIGKKLIRASNLSQVYLTHGLWGEVIVYGGNWFSGLGIDMWLKSAVLAEFKLLFLFDQTFQKFEALTWTHLLVIELWIYVCFVVGKSLDFSPYSLLITLYIVFRDHSHGWCAIVLQSHIDKLLCQAVVFRFEIPTSRTSNLVSLWERVPLPSETRPVEVLTLVPLGDAGCDVFIIFWLLLLNDLVDTHLSSRVI